MTPIIFLIAGFACFVASVLFYLWADDRAWRRDVNAFTQATTQIQTLRKELEETNARADFLMKDRNTAKVQSEELKAEVEKLHDSNASVISMAREVQIRQDAIERHKAALPSTIQISIVDKRAKKVSNQTTQRGGKNETPKPTTPNGQAPKESGAKTRPATKGSPLGRSYRDVEKANSKRSPTRLNGRESLNL